MSTLKNYYDNLEAKPKPPKTALVEELRDECGVNEMTVRRWLSGKNVPQEEHWPTISRITGIPVNELFPETESTQQC